VSHILLLNRRNTGVEPTLFAAELEKFRPFRERLAGSVQDQQKVLEQLTQLWKGLKDTAGRGAGARKWDERERRKKDTTRRFLRARDGYMEVRDGLACVLSTLSVNPAHVSIQERAQVLQRVHGDRYKATAGCQVVCVVSLCREGKTGRSARRAAAASRPSVLGAASTGCKAVGDLKPQTALLVRVHAARWRTNTATAANGRPSYQREPVVDAAAKPPPAAVQRHATSRQSGAASPALPASAASPIAAVLRARSGAFGASFGPVGESGHARQLRLFFASSAAPGACAAARLCASSRAQSVFRAPAGVISAAAAAAVRIWLPSAAAAATCATVLWLAAIAAAAAAAAASGSPVRGVPCSSSAFALWLASGRVSTPAGGTRIPAVPVRLWEVGRPYVFDLISAKSALHGHMYISDSIFASLQSRCATTMVFLVLQSPSTFFGNCRTPLLLFPSWSLMQSRLGRSLALALLPRSLYPLHGSLTIKL
jgi:hypothetical protein